MTTPIVGHINIVNEDEEPQLPNIALAGTVATPTELSGTDIDSLNEECYNLRAELISHRECVQRLTLDEARFRSGGDDEVKFLTGFPSFLWLITP